MMALRSCSSSFTYDVFLSFRGLDTRHGFTGNLYKALHDRGIHTFIDDEELQSGDEITPALVKAIHESRIAITVLSKHYASSTFCLYELATILDCERKGLLVIPVFYNVDPSDVRHQKGSYGEALAKHEERFKQDMDKLQKWKMALHQVANLSAFHYQHGNGYEYKFIERIVELVSREINRAPLNVADYPVGLESQVLQVKKLLDVGSHDSGIHMIGVHGIGGVGKSTLARAVYNNFLADKFDGLCFLENVREESNKHGLKHLQSILLSKILGQKDINLTSWKEGASMIQHRLQHKKVFLVLDDVEKHEQLQAIVGRPDWFGTGSIVIITTRDKQLLASHENKRTYKVKKLNTKDALQLLTWKAFKTEQVHPKYMKALNRVVTYASGLPLALEVIGSNLFGKNIEEWEYAIKQYKRIPNNQILKILKVSFDALEEEEKSVFLDIACCLKDYKLKEVEDILHALYDDCMKYHIGVLVEKSLIKVSWCGIVKLHNLIQEMGKEIDRQKSPKEPGKRNRLWLPKDTIQVLKDNTGTSEVEIICVDFPTSDNGEAIEWNGNAFKEMKSLKILIIRIGNFSKGPNYLPESLRVLEWHRYPSHCLPYDFHPKKLVICKLPDSSITSFELDDLLKKFVNVTVLNFDECKFLTEIPDISVLQNLEELSFHHCQNLITVHDSIGFLDKLKILSAYGCKKLRSFPPIKLTSLEKLELSECSSLERFPEILGKMENIRNLELWGLPIKELPFSFQNLIGLQQLYLGKCGIVQLPSSIVIMPELTHIMASEMEQWQWLKQDKGEEKTVSRVSSMVEQICAPHCNLYDDFFSIGFTWFVHVKEINIRNNNFTILPECIKECQFIWMLDVSDCKHLREIRGIPPNLQHLFAKNCESLTSSSASMFLNKDLHEAPKTQFCLPGAWIPEWFDHQSRGPSSSFWFHGKCPDKVLSLVIAPVEDENEYFSPIPMVFINGKVHESLFFGNKKTVRMEMDHTYLSDLQLIYFDDNLFEVPLEKEWNHVEVTYAGVIETSILKASGIHVFKQKHSMENIRFTDPYRKRKLDDHFESRNHQLLKKCRFVDMEVSWIQFVQQQNCSFPWSSLLNSACSYFHLFLLKQSSHCTIM